MRKFVEIEDAIWSNFCFWNFLQISPDFEINRIFRIEIEIPEN
jgi:hypothetical protein